MAKQKQEMAQVCEDSVVEVCSELQQSLEGCDNQGRLSNLSGSVSSASVGFYRSMFIATEPLEKALRTASVTSPKSLLWKLSAPRPLKGLDTALC